MRMRDPWPGEVVDRIRELMDWNVYCCRTVQEIKVSVLVMHARDVARAATVEAR